MQRSQVVPSASTSMGSLKRVLSPELVQVAAPASSVSSKQTSRRPAKRSKPSPGASQPTPPTQKTAHSTPPSPVKLFKGHVTAAASHRTTESTEETQPGVLKPVVVPQPTVTELSPSFSGNFDLYGMYLPYLAKLCLPPGATSPDYSAVYDRILSSQAKHDYTARCFLSPHDVSTAVPPHGRFESSSIIDPMAERPFEINLDSFTYKKALTFTPTERLSFQVPEHSTSGPGLVGHTGLLPVCGIKNARGIFKIKRVWTREQGGLLRELFEGFFSFSVGYDSMYRKAGHGNGATYKFAFWGVRAMKDNTGKEIGLGPGKTW
ncbi:hypothetical protein JVU11DRAFT_154 [Chiua virens]|nr:hypothetical protein JVU11DRAFT_154 [Chiua virens]